MHQAQCSSSSVYPRLTGPSMAFLPTAAAWPPLASCRGSGPPLPCATETLVVEGRLVAEEHDFLLAIEDQRSLGAHHHFAIAAEPVAVDRRVDDADLLVRVAFVLGARELVDAVNVVFAVAVEREERPHAGAGNGERQRLLAVVAQAADEDARGVQLMAAQLGHQAAAGAVPQPPANQLFQRGALGAVCQRDRLVAVVLGLDRVSICCSDSCSISWSRRSTMLPRADSISLRSEVSRAMSLFKSSMAMPLARSAVSS